MLQVNDVHYFYKTRYQKVEALRGVNCTFHQGKVYSITGKTKSGKTTLLNLLAGLDKPAHGSIQMDGVETPKINRSRFRREHIAMVNQGLNLLPLLSVLENIMYPMELNHISKADAEKKALNLLEQVELPADYGRKLASKLSGDEQQRVAIARALAMPGRIILADEPTSNLNAVNTINVINLFSELAYRQDYCVIIATQDDDITKRSDVVYELKNGEIVTSGSSEGKISTGFEYSYT
ncbi:MAG: transporter ATP-binding protein [Herbinix sp.]|jgi:putative ABC transport system ATP-binding protein|nr:transporter ATP-binding protein [Herbinix sp.]